MFATEILGCLIICQFPNSNIGGHGRTQFDCSWGTSSWIMATHPSHIQPALTKLLLMWHKGVPFTCNPCCWPTLLPLLSRVFLFMSVRVGLYPSPNLLRFSLNSTKLAMSSSFRPKPLPGLYPSLNITRATINAALDERGYTGGDSMSQPTLPREGDARLTGASSKEGKHAELPPTFIRGKRRKKPEKAWTTNFKCERFGSCIYARGRY